MITLSRLIDTHCVTLAATVAVEHDLPEFMPILELAKSLGGEVSPKQLNDELFKPLPLHACKLAITRCVQLRMLQWDGDIARMTELGELATATKKPLIGEQGIWRFYLANDPLVPQAVLHAERLKTKKAFAEISDTKEPLHEFAGARDVPSSITAAKDKYPHRSIQNHKYMQIQDVGHKCQVENGGKIKLELNWSENTTRPKVRLTGELPINGTNLDATIEPSSSLREWTYHKLWIELMSKAAHMSTDHLSTVNEESKERFAPISFDSVETDSRRKFRKDFHVPKTLFGDIGSFDQTILSQVLIAPVSNTAAQNWCEWLQWHEIVEYVTPEMLNMQAQEISSKFTHHRPVPLTPQDLHARALKSHDAHARFILAPADLGLWSES